MTLSSTPVFPQKPTRYATTIGNSDASLWKFLESSLGAYSSADGTDILSLTACSSDSSNRTVQVAVATPVTCTFTNGSAVIACAVTVTAGDIIVLTTTGSLPTNFTSGATNFVTLGSGGAIVPGVSFTLSATAGGSAISAGSAGSGTHTAWIIRVKTSIPVLANSGFDGIVPTTDLMNNALFQGPPVNNDGQRFIRLKGGQALAVSSLATVTANKIIHIGSAAVDFS